jgi:2-succinyl-6-hydroxy-2,4-cyclohexadiene-1-carboxylate synthase
MTDQREPPGPLHHVVEGAALGEGAAVGGAVVGAPTPGALAGGALAPGMPHPPGPVPRPPVGERSPSGGGGRAAVHSPLGPSGLSDPSQPRPGSEVAGGRVVLVHGFTQTLAAWGPVGERLARRREVVRVDLPGHGGSDTVRVGFAEAAGFLGACGGVGTYAGYSLGGRLCLRLALDRPELVRALVLVGASPGIADPAARDERRAADEAMAGRIEREGVAAFLDRWLAGPLFATLPAEAAGRADRQANTAEGLAYALRRLGTGAQEPLWERLATLRPPTLLVAGALDGKFAAIAGQMAAAIGPHARVALVPRAGHAVHLERPAELAALVQEFLDAPLGSPGSER